MTETGAVQTIIIGVSYTLFRLFTFRASPKLKNTHGKTLGGPLKPTWLRAPTQHLTCVFRCSYPTNYSPCKPKRNNCVDHTLAITRNFNSCSRRGRDRVSIFWPTVRPSNTVSVLFNCDHCSWGLCGSLCGASS